MKKTLTVWSGVAALALMAWVSPSFAADSKKEVTITGEGKCAKCAMHEADKCQNVIVTEKGGKKETYYLAQNDMSKEFHDKFCKAPAKVTATGTVKEVDGKKELTVSKIDLAKDAK
jgi:hypothetical protein